MDHLAEYMQRFKEMYERRPKRNVTAGNATGLQTIDGGRIIEREVYSQKGLLLPDGTYACRYQAEVKDPKTGKFHRIDWLGTTGSSDAEIEDQFASSMERTLLKEREREHLRAPTVEERKEIGAALEEFRRQLARRRESSTGRVWF